MSYNPRPPRVWSRVQNRCTFVDNSENNSVFLPLTGKTGTQAEADYQLQMLRKGNVLQYKKNSSSLTKNQRYTQICKGMWTNRTKSYATQTQTYSNPNTSNLQQVNFTSVPTNGNTTYFPGPYNFNIPAPYGCISNTIKDGGSLLCNTIVNPCTDEVIERTRVINCYPTSSSDVPGPIQELCWDPKLETWYPRQRYIMPTSGTKWPEGYKGLVSAVAPNPPYLMVNVTGNIATLTWELLSNNCLPISSFNIYENDKLIANVPYTITSYNVPLTDCTTLFYVTALSSKIESRPSNTVNAINSPYFILTNGSQTYDPSTEIYTVVFNSSGTIQFFCQDSTNNPISVVLIGGGGGGSGGSNTILTTIKGGGGGGGAQTNYFTTNNYTNNVIYNINIGNGGSGGLPLGGAGGNGNDGNQSSLNLTTTYIALGGQGGQASQGGDGGGSGTNGGSVSEPSDSPPYSEGNGGVGINSGTLYGGGGGGGGADGAGPAPTVSGNVAGGGGGGVAYNLTTGLISTAGGGGGGGTPGGSGFAGGIGGSLYGGTGANSNGSNGGNGIYGGGGGGGSGAQAINPPPYYGAGYGGNGGNGICVLKFKLSN
jgi:hypothetical protein